MAAYRSRILFLRNISYSVFMIPYGKILTTPDSLIVYSSHNKTDESVKLPLSKLYIKMPKDESVS